MNVKSLLSLSLDIASSISSCPIILVTYNLDYGDEAPEVLYQVLSMELANDIVEKYKIENENLLNMIVDFLMDIIGSQTSIRNVANSLTSNTYKTNDKTCGSYIEYLCRS